MWNTINIFDDATESDSMIMWFEDWAKDHSRRKGLDSGVIMKGVTDLESLNKPERIYSGELLNNIIFNLIKDRAKHLFDPISEKIKSIEFWINFQTVNAPTPNFRLDLDEKTLAWDDLCKNISNPDGEPMFNKIDIASSLPLWSCCVFITPDEVIGGGISLCDSFECLKDGHPTEHTINIPHKFNRAVFFDSSYPYLINPHQGSSINATLHLNFWDKELIKS